mgnify:FL=1
MDKFRHYRLEDFLFDDEFKDWVLNDGKLSGSIWEEVLSHFPEKSSDLEKAALLIREWKQIPSALTDEQMHADIRNILNDSEKREKSGRRSRMEFLRYAAAAVLGLSLAGFLLYQRYPSSPATKSEAQLMEDRIEIANQEGVDKELNLPDGSFVKLSPGSVISYRVGFAKANERSVMLEGKAYFEVVRDTLRPFQVLSGELTTRVLGTRFTVQSGEDNISVTVSSGKVAVASSGEEAENVVLYPNQTVVYKPSEKSLTKVLAREPVVLDPEELKGAFAFDEEPVADILRALEKAYGIPIRFDEPSLRNCQVTLPFREEPFYQKLEVLCRTIKASYKITGQEVVIESAGCD